MGLFESEEDTPPNKEWFSAVTHAVQIEHPPAEARKAVPEKKTYVFRQTRSKQRGSKTTAKSNLTEQYDLIETVEEYLLRETRETIENIQHGKQSEETQIEAVYDVGGRGREKRLPKKQEPELKPEKAFLGDKQKTISDGGGGSKKSLTTKQHQRGSRKTQNKKKGRAESPLHYIEYILSKRLKFFSKSNLEQLQDNKKQKKYGTQDIRRLRKQWIDYSSLGGTKLSFHEYIDRRKKEKAQTQDNRLNLQAESLDNTLTISDDEQSGSNSKQKTKASAIAKTPAAVNAISNYEFSAGKKLHKPQAQSTFIQGNGVVAELRLSPRRRQVTTSKKEQPKQKNGLLEKRKTKQRSEIKQKEQKLYSAAELRAFSDKWRTWTQHRRTKPQKQHKLEENLLGKNRKKPKRELEEDSSEEVFNEPAIQAIRDKCAKNFEAACSYYHDKETRPQSRKRRRQYQREHRKKENKDKNSSRDKSPFQIRLREALANSRHLEELRDAPSIHTIEEVDTLIVPTPTTPTKSTSSSPLPDLIQEFYNPSASSSDTLLTPNIRQQLGLPAQREQDQQTELQAGRHVGSPASETHPAETRTALPEEEEVDVFRETRSTQMSSGAVISLNRTNRSFHDIISKIRKGRNQDQLELQPEQHVRIPTFDENSGCSSSSTLKIVPVEKIVQTGEQLQYMISITRNILSGLGTACRQISNSEELNDFYTEAVRYLDEYWLQRLTVPMSDQKQLEIIKIVLAKITETS